MKDHCPAPRRLLSIFKHDVINVGIWLGDEEIKMLAKVTVNEI